MLRIKSVSSGTKTLRVKVLYFAQLRELLGGKCIEELTLEDKTSAGELVSIITKKYSVTNSLKKSISISINCQIVGRDTLLKDGDEVALLPPVSGG